MSTAITAAAAAAAVGSGGASSLSAAGAIDNTDAMDTSADDVDPNTNGHIAATTNTGEQESSQPPQPPPPVDPLAQETAAILADTRLTLNQREAKARFYQAFFALSTMEQVSINQWFKWYPGRWASGYEKRRGKGIRQTGIPNADRMKAMEIAIVGFLRDGVTEEGVPEKWDILDKLLHKYERPSSEKDQDSDAASVNGGEEQEDEEAGDEDTVADHASTVNVNLNNYKSTTASSSVNGDNSNNKWDGVEGGEESELSDVGEYEENDGEVDDDDDDDDNHGGASKRKRKSKVQQQPRKTYKRKVHVKSRASRRIQVLDEKKEEDHDELEDDDDDDNYHQQTRTSSRRGATKSSNSKSTRRSSTRRESASSSLPSSPGALAAIQMVEQEISKKPRGDLSGGDAVMTTERNARREQREESAKVNANASSENIDDLCRVVEHNFMSLLSPEEKLIIMSRLIEDYAVDSEDIKTYIDECSRKSWEIKMELKEVVRDRKAV